MSKQPLVNGETGTTVVLPGTKAACILRPLLFNGLDEKSFVFVDVRDSAMLHVLSQEVEEAGGKRFLTSSGLIDWQLACTFFLRTLYSLPFAKPPRSIDKALHDAGIQGAPAYDPEFIKNFNPDHKYSNKQSLEVFKGFKYRGIPETIKDAWVDLQERGWISAEGKGVVSA